MGFKKVTELGAEEQVYLSRKKELRWLSPERGRTEKNLQWGFGQGTSENKMSDSMWTHFSSCYTRVSSGRFLLLMNVFVWGDSLWEGKPEEMMGSVSKAGKGQCGNKVCEITRDIRHPGFKWERYGLGIIQCELEQWIKEWEHIALVITLQKEVSQRTKSLTARGRSTWKDVETVWSIVYVYSPFLKTMVWTWENMYRDAE